MSISYNKIFNTTFLLSGMIGSNSSTPISAIEMKIGFINETTFVINTARVSDDVKNSSFASLVPKIQSYIDGLNLGQHLDYSQGLSDMYDNLVRVVGKAFDSFYINGTDFFDKGLSRISIKTITPASGHFGLVYTVNKGFSSNNVELQYLKTNIWTAVIDYTNSADGDVTKASINNPQTGSTQFRIVMTNQGFQYISRTVTATLA